MNQQSVLSVLVLSLTLTGCATFSSSQPSGEYAGRVDELVSGVPDWANVQTDWTNAQTDYSESPETVPNQLSDLIQNADLDALVRRALAHNPGLQQTLLALEQTSLSLRQTRADRYPTAEAGLSASKNAGEDTQYTGSLTLSWQLDLWAQIEDGINAAEQTLFQQQATYQAARDALAAEVMNTWLSLVADQRALEIEQRRLQSLETVERLIVQRYQRGLSALDDLDSARSSTLSARASVRELQQSVRQSELTLNTLTGDTADTHYQVPADYPQVASAPITLPEQTLARRPDLLAAYHGIAVAESNARVAYKDLLPRIDLQAALQDVGDSPSAALLTDPVWSVLGQLTAPLFQGGKLRAAAKSAELETAIQYQSYRETLLNAVEEVRTALDNEQALAERSQYVSQALAQQQQALSRYQEKYRAGNATILELLSVQQETYDLESQLDTLIFTRLSNRITLASALGLGASYES